jgi:transcription elongation factor GreA
MDRVLLTPEGSKNVWKELSRLKRKERPRIIEAIAEARAHGDLSENAEYHAAREQQGFVEGRIRELEAKLARAEVIDPADLNVANRVVFGVWVDLWEEEGDRKVTYQIVGELEADVSVGKVSHSSPIAKALLGKEVGDEVEFKAPGGTRRYEILQVRYEVKPN